MQRKNVPYLARVWVPEGKRDAPGVVSAFYNLMKAAGGFTGTRARGAWIDPDGDYIEENSVVFEFVYGDDEWDVEPTLYHFAQALLDTGEQAVLVEINGRRVMLS